MAELKITVQRKDKWKIKDGGRQREVEITQRVSQLEYDSKDSNDFNYSFGFRQHDLAEENSAQSQDVRVIEVGSLSRPVIESRYDIMQYLSLYTRKQQNPKN